MLPTRKLPQSNGIDGQGTIEEGFGVAPDRADRNSELQRKAGCYCSLFLAVISSPQPRSPEGSGHPGKPACCYFAAFISEISQRCTRLQPKLNGGGVTPQRSSPAPDYADIDQ